MAAAPGAVDDERTSIVYNAATGELSVDSPVSTELTSVFITSSSGLFLGEKPTVLDGPFDSFAADNVFKSTIRGSFGAVSLGTVLPAGLSSQEVIADLSASGSLVGGGGLGDIDLIYVPEPGSLLLAVTGMLAIVTRRRK